MNINEVIKYPILTEKTYSQMQNNIYSFVVDARTNKVEIKKTIEFIFGVKVSKVNIMNYDKKPKRVGKFFGFTNSVKKAIVTLSEGKINLFPDEENIDGVSKDDITKLENKIGEEIKPKDKEVKKEVSNKTVSEVEKRAAEKIAAKKTPTPTTKTSNVEKAKVEKEKKGE